MPLPFTTRPEIAGSFGVVTATHWIAAQAGMRMLELGGNAFDAAAAAGFTLQVVMPHMNGPGGDVPIIIAKADGAVEVICGQGTAPAAASIEYFEGLGLELVPGTGPLAAVVPGAFGAWLAIVRDHGTLDISEILGPAAHYAAHGWPLHRDTAGFINEARPSGPTRRHRHRRGGTHPTRPTGLPSARHARRRRAPGPALRSRAPVRIGSRRRGGFGSAGRRLVDRRDRSGPFRSARP